MLTLLHHDADLVVSTSHPACSRIVRSSIATEPKAPSSSDTPAIALCHAIAARHVVDEGLRRLAASGIEGQHDGLVAPQFASSASLSRKVVMRGGARPGWFSIAAKWSRGAARRSSLNRARAVRGLMATGHAVEVADGERNPSGAGRERSSWGAGQPPYAGASGTCACQHRPCGNAPAALHGFSAATCVAAMR